MLTRVESFFDFLGVPDAERILGLERAALTGEVAQGMTHQKDYEALAAVVLHKKPRLIFEIGTFKGVTSDFFLQLLPETRVVSIAYVNPRLNPFRNKYNNSDLTKEHVGTMVAPERRARFHQLIGDSHQLNAETLLRDHGPFDMMFIDGDHSRDGVFQDTELAKKILDKDGVICWHDANPKEKYLPVRNFLEKELPWHGIATKDDYIGGIACWSPQIERKLQECAIVA